MKHSYLIFFFFLISGKTTCLGQPLQEILLQKEEDSTFMQVYEVKFDDNGHFLYDKRINDTSYLFQNGKVKIAANPYSYGKMTECHDYSELHQHYYIDDFHFIYGPTTGDDLGSVLSPKSGKGMHELVSLLENNRVNLYYDGKFYKKLNDTITESNKISTEHAFIFGKWAALSSNGNILLKIKSDGTDSLFLNGKLVDTCNNYIGELNVNNTGNYTFLKVYKYERDGKEIYPNVLHTKDTSLFLGACFPGASYLFNHNGYYCLDYLRNSKLQVINNNLYHVRGRIHYLEVPDKINHLMLVQKEDQHYALVSNGKTVDLDYDEIFCPTIDQNGNSALVGKRNYFLYKWINGKESSEPVTRFGIRPEILHVSTSGEVVAAYSNGDSTFIYRNDQLLFSGKAKEISLSNHYAMLRSQSRENQIEHGGKSWIYIQVRDSSYILWNGKLSPPLKAFSNFSPYSDNQKDNQIAACELNENGYFVVIRRPNNECELVVNNRPPVKFKANRIFRNAYLNEEYLTFYGVKDFSLFQFKLPTP